MCVYFVVGIRKALRCVFHNVLEPERARNLESCDFVVLSSGVYMRDISISGLQNVLSLL